MVKKTIYPSAAINKSIAALQEAGLQQSFDNIALDALLSPALATAKTLSITLPQDNTKQTADIIFDKKTGSIIGWKKTPRELHKGNVTLKVLVKPDAKFLPKGVMRTFIFDKVFKNAIREIAEEIDEAIKPAEVLQRFDQHLKLPPLTAQEKTAMAGKRVLLLVHGIFSKTEAAFSGLAKSYKSLEKIYGDRIIAYDHFTLCKSTKENAADLLAQLPENTMIDIVCHSRGAGVVRFLVEQASNRNQLKHKGITVGSVCFVAGACEGSPLATKEAADSLFKLIAQLMAFSGGQSAPWLKAFGLLIRAAISGVQEFPGIKSMDPFGKDIVTLAGSVATAATRYCYIRANFDPNNLILRFGEGVIVDLTLFKKAANDVIVPWKGASVSTHYLPAFKNKVDVLGFDTTGAVQGEVWHINFFDQAAVRQQLLDTLR